MHAMTHIFTLATICHHVFRHIFLPWLTHIYVDINYHPLERVRRLLRSSWGENVTTCTKPLNTPGMTPFSKQCWKSLAERHKSLGACPSSKVGLGGGSPWLTPCRCSVMLLINICGPPLCQYFGMDYTLVNKTETKKDFVLQAQHTLI